MKTHLLEEMKDFLFPQVRCLAYDEPRRIIRDQALCEACKAELEQLRIPASVCGHCLSPVRAGSACAFCRDGGMLGLDQAFAPYIYHGVSQRLIVMLKFGPVSLAAEPLAREMALCISGIRFDALVPVPLHKARQRERGMNQSRLLCDLIARQTGFPVREVLEKTRNIRRQSSLPSDRREENIRGAIKSSAAVDGLDLLLVDDVRTSGATARECARVLREAGAASVCLLTAAVAAGGAK